MGKNITMKARDTIAAKLAECFVTIGTRRYNFMQMIDCEWKVEKTKASVPRLGAIMVGHKSCGMEGTFSGTAHYNQTVLRQALLDYKDTGEDLYFEMQVTNDDPTSAAKRQSVFFMIVIQTEAFWRNLMQMVSIWMKRLREPLKISPFQKALRSWKAS